MELTILMPCLNEAMTVGKCVTDARYFLESQGIDGEVVIADNGSTDGSQGIAQKAGARVIAVNDRGYGAALIGGINSARSKFIIMGDADDSYDFKALGPYISELRAGVELVMGNRFKGGISPGAMPFLHRYLGNPVLSALGRILFRLPVGDFHCGLRGFNTAAVRQLHLQSPGMEFATEMVAKSYFASLSVKEVPTTLRPDGRGRPPHLRTWRDGWRHLRFMLLFSPDWLFIGPGLLLLIIGLLGISLLASGPVRLGNLGFDVHTLIFSAASTILGFQSLQWGALVRWLSSRSGMRPVSNALGQRLSGVFTLEYALIIGLLLMAAGALWSWTLFAGWAATDFGAIESNSVLRQSIVACTVMILGLQWMGGSLCAAALSALLKSGFRGLRQ
ncbi:MAG: glycosyltransferase family 2 protein [Hyphomicrobiales bacterium]|nr:MAG: glycosyltransferase family 2 protein [Hyphomicrobiales bacterium]